MGLIDLAGGSYSGPYAKGNRNTRIRASEQLREIFQGAGFIRDDVGRAEDQECIILKQGDEAGDGSRPQEYEDTSETNQMRSDLQAYNALLSSAFIDIPSLEGPYIDVPISKGPETGGTKHQPIDQDHKFIRRIFSRGDWGLNGRFYGGWWQQIGSDLRSQVFINDQPTVEVDFKGMHVAMLSLENGVELKGDPYELPKGTIPGVPAVLQRSLIKQLVLIAINAGNKESAYRSFRNGFPTGHVAKGMTNIDLSRLITAFTEKHPQLEASLCSDQGIRLMYQDGLIANLIHNHFTAQSIPVLSVHDSYIIDYNHVGELRSVMSEASQSIIGEPLAVSSNGTGLDELTDDRDFVVQDFIRWQQSPRSPGYLQRLANHEERFGAVT